MIKVNRDSFPHLVAVLLDRVRGKYSRLLMVFYMKWWRIDFGVRARFYGTTCFRRHPNSQISLGNNCCFRSAEWSNLAGLNHSCVITTLSDNAVINIGNDCGFSGAVIAAAESVLISDRVLIGANSIISDTDWHHIDKIKRRESEKGESSPIVIENDVWLGMNVVVLKGVTIGAGAVVAANSVVIKDIPPNVLAAGIPAKVIREVLVREKLC
jgi:acetyltransferase-like isoleucine patch superfamily enzyme